MAGLVKDVKMFETIALEIDSEAVVVQAPRPLAIVSSAVVGGGFAHARSIVNLHIAKNLVPEDLEGAVAALARRRRLAAPWVGLLTSAWTEKAAVASEAGHGLSALVVVTVGLGNPAAAGWTAAAVASAPSTINTIVVADANPSAAALVNAVMTVTEVKTAVLGEAGIRCPDGRPATGTSTDAVVVAATGRGRACRYGGPISDLGWVVARAARSALEDGVRSWLEERARLSLASAGS